MEKVIFIPMTIEDFEETISKIVDKALEKATIPSSSTDPNQRLTVAEVCKLYNISKPTVYDHMKSKPGLKYAKVGRKTLFRAGDVEEYFKSLIKL